MALNPHTGNNSPHVIRLAALHPSPTLSYILSALPRSPLRENKFIIQLHVDTMKRVIGDGMKGDGGAEGEAVLKGLAALIEKATNN